MSEPLMPLDHLVSAAKQRHREGQAHAAARDSGRGLRPQYPDKRMHFNGSGIPWATPEACTAANSARLKVICPLCEGSG
jgi:hypothetical protein